MKTFANRASAIMKKYPNHKKSTIDHESMIDELTALAEEQEQEKAVRQPQQEQSTGDQNLFPDGGPTGRGPKPGEPGWNDEVPANKPKIATTKTKEEKDAAYAKNLNELEMGMELENQALFAKTQEQDIVADPEVSSKTGGDEGEKGFFGRLGDKFSENKEDIYNIASAVTPALTNYLNMRNVGEASRVNPTPLRASVKPTWFNSLPIEERLQQSAASSSYGLAERGTDADSYIKGLRLVNQDAQTNLGDVMTKGQEMNMAEQRRLDTIQTNVNKYNAEGQTQADVDYHQEAIDKAQLKRDYLAGIGENIGGGFKDLADSSLAKKMGKQYELLAKTLATNNKG